MSDMQIEFMSIEKVNPYQNNPRINDGGVESLAESIKQFGWQQPIVVDKKYTIIVGHTRYKAAKFLKLKEIPVYVANSLSDEQITAYRLADNKTGELSEWDYDKLVEEIEKASGTDFSKLGFSDIELLGLTEDFAPEDFGDEEGYEDIGEAQLKVESVTITYKKKDEEKVKALIGEVGDLKVVYRTSEIMKNLDEKNNSD